MPGGNNPNNSVGGGWHITHNIIQQIYSYSAHSGQQFDEVKRNPNIKCKDNKLIFEATYKMDGRSNQVDTGIFFSDMMIYLLSKPKNKNDNSYNTRTTLPISKNEKNKKNEQHDKKYETQKRNGKNNKLEYESLEESLEESEEELEEETNLQPSLKDIDLPTKNKGKKTNRRKDKKKSHLVNNSDYY